MQNILKRIFTPKFALSALISILFALFLRYFYQEVLELTLSIEKFDLTNLSFVSVFTIFKRILSIILDEVLPHTLAINSPGKLPDDKPQPVYMSDRTPEGSGSNKNNLSI